jgi:hypothetical protein
MSNHPVITFNHAHRLVKHSLMRGAAIMLRGSPSSGKTAVGYKVAKECKFTPIVFSLLDHDPVDIAGLPDLSGNKATFKTFDTFPIAGDHLPEGSNGWLIMLDEFCSGTRAMQSAANRLLYERMVGNHQLHERAFVMAMGNLDTDNAFVQEMPAHTKSRQIHLYVTQDIQEWIEWAIEADLDKRVISYAMSKPTTITKYDPEYVGINYPCARTMEMLSEQIKGAEVTRDLLPLVQGTIGEGVGLEFYNFTQLSDKLPDMKEVLRSPSTAPLPEKMAYKWAMAGIIVEAFSTANAASLMTYLARLPKDYQYIILRMSIQSDSSILSNSEVDAWVTENANYFYK